MLKNTENRTLTSELKNIVNKNLQLTPSKIHACSFCILAFRWTFVHLTLRTTGTALAWKTLAPMRPADVKTFRRTNTITFRRTKVLSISRTFCLNKFNNISVDSISGITFRFTFSVSPPMLGPGQRAVWLTQLQHICLARWTLWKAKQISCNRQRSN
jgi:hypothetical protein